MAFTGASRLLVAVGVCCSVVQVPGVVDVIVEVVLMSMFVELFGNQLQFCRLFVDTDCCNSGYVVRRLGFLRFCLRQHLHK